MASSRIKLCGINSAVALEAALTGRASHAGLNFHPPSPRHVSSAEAAELARRAEGRIALVGVFVDPDDALLAQTLAAVPLAAVQLHGAESPQRAGQIRARFGLPVWKALAITTREDLDRTAAWPGAADFVLLDAKTPPGMPPGGMGLAFDWGLLNGWHPALPWGLAGGLSPANVAEAIHRTAAPLVDCASGVERAPGEKDPALIAAFCAAVLTA